MTDSQPDPKPKSKSRAKPKVKSQPETKPAPKQKPDIKYMLRFTAEEKRLLEEKSEKAGISMAAILRQAVQDVTVHSGQERPHKDLKTLNSEIRRIGINVNQIATWVNTYKSQAEIIPVIRRLVAIEKALHSLSRELNGGGGDDAD